MIAVTCSTASRVHPWPDIKLGLDHDDERSRHATIDDCSHCDLDRVVNCVCAHLRIESPRSAQRLSVGRVIVATPPTGRLKGRPILLRPACDDPQRVVRQRPLKRQGVRRVRLKPTIDLARRRQNDGHGVWMDRPTIALHAV